MGDLDDEFARFQAELFEAELAAKQAAPDEQKVRSQAGRQAAPPPGALAAALRYPASQQHVRLF